MTHPLRAAHRGGRRLLPLVWAASAVSAAVLVLGVNGTLSSWTTAIINNDTNNVSTGAAVVLRESSGSAGCLSTTGDSTNSSTCTTINKYGGGTIVPVAGSNTQQVDITFTNVGSAPATTFSLTPNTCSQTVPAAAATTGATATPGVTDLCAAGSGELGLTVGCSTGTTYVSTGTGAWTTGFTYPVAGNGSFNNLPTLTHTSSANQTLNVGDSWTCRFVVTLSTTASPTDAANTVRQQLKWTLTA